MVEGSTGAPKGTAWAPGFGFFLVNLGNLFGVDLYQSLFSLGFRLSILSVIAEVCVIMALGEKMMPGSVVGCVENIINTMAFVW